MTQTTMPDSILAVLRPLGLNPNTNADQFNYMLKQGMIKMAAVGDTEKYHQLESYLRK